MKQTTRQVLLLILILIFMIMLGVTTALGDLHEIILHDENLKPLSFLQTSSSYLLHNHHGKLFRYDTLVTTDVFGAISVPEQIKDRLQHLQQLKPLNLNQTISLLITICLQIQGNANPNCITTSVPEAPWKIFNKKILVEFTTSSPVTSGLTRSTFIMPGPIVNPLIPTSWQRHTTEMLVAFIFIAVTSVAYKSPYFKRRSKPSFIFKKENESIVQLIKIIQPTITLVMPDDASMHTPSSNNLNSIDRNYQIYLYARQQ